MSEIAAEYLNSVSNENTRMSYRGSLTMLSDFLTKRGRPLDEIGTNALIADDIIAFFAALRDQHDLSPSTLNAHITGVTSFLLWLTRQNQEGFGPREFMAVQEKVVPLRGKTSRGRSRPVSEKSIQSVLEAADILAILALETDDMPERLMLMHLRNRALVRVFHLGLRTGEVIGLCRHDLDAYQKTIGMTGTGGLRRRFLVDDQTWAALQEYLVARDKMGFVAVGDEPVFGRHDKLAHRRGEILPINSTGSVRVAFSTVASWADTEDHITPKNLRQLSAMIVLNAANDLGFLRESLDYDILESKDIRACLDDSNPEENHTVDRPGRLGR